jgi:hypothetical protein
VTLLGPFWSLSGDRLHCLDRGLDGVRSRYMEITMSIHGVHD